MLTASNTIQTPLHTASAKVATRFGLQGLNQRATAITMGPAADMFVRADKPETSVTSAVSKPATALKELLNQDANRKANAAMLFKAVSNLLPVGRTEPKLDEGKKAALDVLAQNIQKMTPLQKVDLMREVTGAESPYSKVAETILVQRQTPQLKDMLNCLKPPVENNGMEGLAAGIQAMGMGLLMLPVLGPTSLLLKPGLFSQVLASLAIAIL